MMFTSCDRHTQSNLEKFHKRSRLSRSHELVSVDFITLSHRERTDPPHAAADAPSSGSGIRNECYGCDAAGFKQSQKPLNTMKDAEIRAHHLTWRSVAQELRAWPQPDLTPTMRGAFLCFQLLLLKPSDCRLILCFHAATGFTTRHEKSAETAADRKSITANTYYLTLPNNNEFTLMNKTAFMSFIEIVADVLCSRDREN